MKCRFTPRRQSVLTAVSFERLSIALYELIRKTSSGISVLSPEDLSEPCLILPPHHLLRDRIDFSVARPTLRRRQHWRVARTRWTALALRSAIRSTPSRSFQVRLKICEWGPRVPPCYGVISCNIGVLHTAALTLWNFRQSPKAEIGTKEEGGGRPSG